MQPLTPKAFDVLRYLVEHADRLVTQDELLEALWPETYVNPEGIRKYILEIRKVLGDRSGEPGFIETFPEAGLPVRSCRYGRPHGGPCVYSGQPLRKYRGAPRWACPAGRLFASGIGWPATGGLRNGEAGIGKTTLCRRVPATGCSVIRIYESREGSALRVSGGWKPTTQCSRP